MLSMKPLDTSSTQWIDALAYSPDGLIPVIAQDNSSGTVLMLAYANAHSLRETLRTGYMHYWSRSRGKLWKKGEESGHVQKLVTLYVDCDADTLLAKVDQTGPACHTGEANCFFRKLKTQAPPR